MGYQEQEKTMNYAWKKENWLPDSPKQRRVFHDGQFQGWEYVNDDGRKGIEIFYCFVENYRVGQYLLTLSDVSMAKSFVAGIQKWIDEMEGKDAIKDSWMADVNRISMNRSWTEIENHFLKHLGEMERLDKTNKERTRDKAFSLLDLTAFAVRKMDINFDLDFNLDKIDYKKLKERIDVHEKLLQEQRIKDEEDKKKEIDRQKIYEKLREEDSDTD